MCDPISIGLTVAGAAMQGIAKQQSDSSSLKLTTAAISDERARQNSMRTADLATQKGYDNQNFATAGDTLNTYSRPVQDKMQADQTDKLQSAYTAPISGQNFTAPLTTQNGAVQAAVNKSGATYKAKSLAEALAKGKLDATGNVNLASSIASAGNAANIQKNVRFKNWASQDYQTASQDSQQVLPMEENAANLKGQQAGATLGQFGDLFSLAGSLYGLGGAAGLFGGAANGGLGSATAFGARNGISGLANGFSYTSPMAGMANSGVYARALAPL